MIVLGGTAALHAYRAWGAVFFADEIHSFVRTHAGLQRKQRRTPGTHSRLKRHETREDEATICGLSLSISRTYVYAFALFCSSPEEKTTLLETPHSQFPINAAQDTIPTCRSVRFASDVIYDLIYAIRRF